VKNNINGILLISQNHRIRSTGRTSDHAINNKVWLSGVISRWLH